MKTISQYREDIKALMKKSADIDAQCVNENREPTEAELALKNELLDAAEDTRKLVMTMERQERLQSALEKPQEPITKPGPTRTPGIEVGADNRSKDKFNSFGEQMAAVMRAGSGGQVDPRLYNAATGASETVPSDGGFLVQQDFSSEILKQVFETAVIASKVRRIQISGTSNSIKLNGIDETSRATGSRYGGIRGYWADEAAEKTASKPKFRKIELSLKKMVGLCYATDELLDDAPALEGVIRQGFTSEFGFMLDDAIINGTGAGQPLGIMSSGCLVSVAKEAGQPADTVVYENIIKMWSRLFARSRGNAVWLVNQNVEPQLHQMSLAVGTGGGPVYLPPGGISGQPYSTLFGRPVLAIEQCQTLGDQGDIILADFADGYILAEKGGMKSDMSIHVRFIYDESVFRFVMRVDGSPWLSSAVTPYKGGSSYTQSHFITLAERA